MEFTVHIHDDETGGFWAEVAELPGCITQGDTEQELEANVAEVIELMLDGLIEDYVKSIKSRPGIEDSETKWRIELRFERSKAQSRT